MAETVGPTTPIELVETAYPRYPRALADARRRLGRPLTFAEKILFAHADDSATVGIDRGVDYADYRPDRVAMQDATAQMALLQFMTAGLPRVQVPSTVHCDHLIQARVGADADLASALDVNSEVYEFLRSVSAKYGIGFWKPGSGIIHQVVLEQYAFPGGMMIGTDSHTPNAGGLGMVAIGVGGADAVDVMAGWPFNTKVPKVIGVHLRGELSGWAAAEGRHPQGRRHPHREGRHRRDRRVLRPRRRVDLGHRQGHDLQHGRRDRRDLLAVPVRRAHRPPTSRRPGAKRSPTSPTRTPSTSASTPRCSTIPSGSSTASSTSTSTSSSRTSSVRTPPTSTVRSPRSGPRPREEDYPVDISYALVGSCTNSSYEDIGRAAHVARQASAHGLSVKTPLLITPGSEQVRATIERDGLLADLEAIGATVLANACGPCIGQWQRDDIEKGERNTIVSSFNRNFPARNDGNAATLSFIGSPETVVAMALTGRLDVDFVREPVVAPDGTEVQLERAVGRRAAGQGLRSRRVGLPAAGRRPVDRSTSWCSPTPSGSSCSSRSRRGTATTSPGCTVLMKAVGKCTTDHISPAGPWLKYRGHLTNISGNLFIGVNNAFALDEPRVRASTCATAP